MQLRIKATSLRSLLLPIIFFLIYFNPPFMPRISFTIIFVVIGGLYCALNLRRSISILKSEAVRKWIVLFLVFYVYYFFVAIISSTVNSLPEDPITTFVGTIIDTVSLLVVSLFLCLISFRKDESFDDFTKYMVGAGVIESIFGIASFISPGVKLFLNRMTIANSRSEKIIHAVRTATFRNYGIASTLFDSFGFGMSIIALLALYKTLEGKTKYYVYFAMITFAACINARTSMVLIAVGSAILVLGKSARSFKVIAGKVLVILISVFALGAINGYIDQGGANALWLSGGIDEIKALLFEGQKTGIFISLFSELYIPPSALQIIFGIGLMPAQAIRRTTDVGYIQNLWQFGIIGSLLLYWFYLNPLRRWIKDNRKQKELAIAIGVVMFVFLIKLNLFGYGISSTVFISLFMARLYTIAMKLNDRQQLIV